MNIAQVVFLLLSLILVTSNRYNQSRRNPDMHYTHPSQVPSWPLPVIFSSHRQILLWFLMLSDYFWISYKRKHMACYYVLPGFFFCLHNILSFIYASCILVFNLFFSFYLWVVFHLRNMLLCFLSLANQMFALTT